MLGLRTMRFSIIVPTYQSAATLRLLLESLTQQTFADYEVIVVDDASTDDTRAVVAGFPVRYERMAHNAGPAAARNRGVELSSGEWLVFTDADTIFRPETLATIDEVLRQSDAHALFGTYAGKPADGSSFMARYKALWEHYAIVMPFEGRGSELHPMTTWVPRPGVVRRDAFDHVGGFDTRFRGADLEDLELGYRLHEAGHPIYFAAAVHISHHYPHELHRALRSFARRCTLWMRMAVRRRRFDPAGEGAPRQALTHLVGFGAFCAAALSPAYPPLVVPALGGAVGYVLLNAPFIALAAREEGPWFAVRALATCELYSVVLGLAASWGLVTALRGER